MGWFGGSPSLFLASLFFLGLPLFSWSPSVFSPLPPLFCFRPSELDSPLRIQTANSGEGPNGHSQSSVQLDPGASSRLDPDPPQSRSKCSLPPSNKKMKIIHAAPSRHSTTHHQSDAGKSQKLSTLHHQLDAHSHRDQLDPDPCSPLTPSDVRYNSKQRACK